MKNKYLDIVVKNLLKFKNNLINTEKLKDIMINILDLEYSDQKMYKMCYYLKNRWYLQSLKKDIFLVKNPETEYTSQQLLEMFYWNVLKKHCKDYLKSDRYIWWIKALELANSSFDIPEEILIINQYKQATEIIMSDKKWLFKTYQIEDKNLFTFFFKFTWKRYVGKNVFDVAWMELAILESLYNPSSLTEWYINEFIKKIIRKYKKSLDVKIREKILMNNKHHSSVNRLYKLCLWIDPEFSDRIKMIIKKYSYFI